MSIETDLKKLLTKKRKTFIMYILNLNTFEREKLSNALNNNGLESLLIHKKMRDFFIFLFALKFF